MTKLFTVMALLLTACPEPTDDSDTDTQSDSDTQPDCDTDTDECDDDSDTAPEPDTDCDTDSPLEDIPDVDTETCTPDPVTDTTVDYEDISPEEGVALSCSVPLTTCRTWSQAQQLSNYRCVESTALTGCAATRRTYRRSAEDSYWSYFDSDGHLIASKHESDYNLTCEQRPDDSGTAWTRWNGPRITGCVDGQTAFSRRCLPDTPEVFPGGNRPIPSSVPATLTAAMTELTGQCYGVATCGCAESTGTVVIVASHWSQQVEESADHWFYNTSGSLMASVVDDRGAGTPPPNCEDRTVVPSDACGFLPLE